MTQLYTHTPISDYESDTGAVLLHLEAVHHNDNSQREGSLRTTS